MICGRWSDCVAVAAVMDEARKRWRQEKAAGRSGRQYWNEHLDGYLDECYIECWCVYLCVS
jgi:hypothetical protein